MQQYTYKFQFEELFLLPEQLERVMGYDQETIPEPFVEIIEDVFLHAKSFKSIQGGMILKDNIQLVQGNKQLKIDEAVFDIKNVIYQQIKKAEKVAVFTCTAGPEIGEWSQQLMADGDLMKGYVADVMGSMMVEAAMDLIQKSLEERMANIGLKISNRYSPGYCGWDVSEQHQLFSIMPQKFCGVSLSDTALMNPIKSVSGIIAIGRDVTLNPYTCKMCDLKTCLYRNRK